MLGFFVEGRGQGGWATGNCPLYEKFANNYHYWQTFRTIGVIALLLSQRLDGSSPLSQTFYLFHNQLCFKVPL